MRKNISDVISSRKASRRQSKNASAQISDRSEAAKEVDSGVPSGNLTDGDGIDINGTQIDLDIASLPDLP